MSTLFRGAFIACLAIISYGCFCNWVKSELDLFFVDGRRGLIMHITVVNLDSEEFHWQKVWLYVLLLFISVLEYHYVPGSLCRSRCQFNCARLNPVGRYRYNGMVPAIGACRYMERNLYWIMNDDHSNTSHLASVSLFSDSRQTAWASVCIWIKLQIAGSRPKLSLYTHWGHTIDDITQY